MTSVDEARDYLASRGLTTKIAQAAKLRPGKGHMAGRLVFPWLDEQDAEIYQTGRALNGQEPKYLHCAGERPALYAIPDSWKSSRVAVVEGQIDALAVAQAGTAAFACSGALTNAALEILVRKKAVVLALDDDEHGRRLAEQARDALGGKVELLEVTWPEGCKDAGDVAQRAAKAGDDPTEAVAEVISDAVKVEIEAEPDVDTFLASNDEEEFAWLIDGIIERGERILLTGREGAGKSVLIEQIAMQVAAGLHPFDGLQLAPVVTTVVDLENSVRELCRRLRPLRSTAGDELKRETLFIYSRPEGLDLGDNEEDQAWLRERVALTGCDLLCIGPLYKATLGNPNDEQDSKALATFLDELRAAFGVAVILEAHLTHESHGGRPFGWSGWRRWPEIGLELKESGALSHWRTPRHETPGLPPALKRGGQWPFTVATKASDVLWARIVDHSRVQLTRPTVRDLAAAFSVGKSTVQRVVDEHRGEWEGLFDD